jgi:hypothetical protein
MFNYKAENFTKISIKTQICQNVTIIRLIFIEKINLLIAQLSTHP